MERAVGDLQAKYASGRGGDDASENGPTGTAYKAAGEEARKQRLLEKRERELHQAAAEEAEQVRKLDRAIDNDEVFDDDSELERLRAQRMKELQAQKQEKIENLGKGHGAVREITQDEFLGAVTSSTRVVCHFYHRDFERCKITNHHLEKLAPRHVETKFLKIDADKAPFFVQKLIIRTMPTLVCFVDGVAVDKVVGFDGLADTMPEGKEDEWPTVYLANLLADKNMLDRENIVDEDAQLEQQRQRMEAMRLAYMTGAALDDDDDIDLTDL